MRIRYLAWIWPAFRTFFLIGMSYVVLYPMLTMLTYSFRTASDVLDPSVVWIPRSVTLDHIWTAWNKLKYAESFRNTVEIDVISTLLQVFSCALVGYGFAKYQFWGRGLLFGLVLFTIVVPPQTVTVPLYLQYRYFNPPGLGEINLLNTGWTFYLPSLFGVGLRSGLFIYIFRQFFRGMPNELLDAAKMDGSGHFRTFFRIMLPNALPAIMTVFLFSFVWHWNDFALSSMFLHNKHQTLSLMLAKGIDMLGRNINQDPVTLIVANASALLVAIPPLIVFAVAQRYFIESVERTGIKG